MSASSRSMLTLVQRCVALSHQTTARCALIPRPTWTSSTRTAASLRGLCRLRCPSVARITQRSLCSEASCEEKYPPLPAYQSDTMPTGTKEVYIVQVKGLPWSCTAQDLVHFFSECRIRDGTLGVHMTVDHQGRPSGRAFVEMEHEEDVSKALEKHRQYLGPRYVEVYEVTNSDAEGILKKAALFPADTRVVRLRGLPFTCTEDDIVRFFYGLEIMEKGITMVINSRGRRSGDAFVWFSSQEAADEALHRDRELIGNRYIEVFPSSSQEIHSTWRSSSQSANDTTTRKRVSPIPTPATPARPAAVSVPNPKLSNLSHHVHLRGLPFHVSGEDIVKFFAPVVASRIRLDLGPDGKASGEADVYFTSHEDAVAAMSKDRMYIGERYIELFLNSAPDNER
ncbi:G-rich sequence factor 1 isoform X1 [Phycodurus eques]|uniref:G-rich sequence factor 1 isoform X1 n=2 Tax=Phycodurus eques TaxID=693459 RepID=UPI002ACDFEF6|nr:G-rich sequence factor 1 isoform X1 [Phycodurus eques]XP_061528336.1 G-rich sequence factor 1 isoform X1 [Phycodurus eques]